MESRVGKYLMKITPGLDGHLHAVLILISACCLGRRASEIRSAQIRALSVNEDRVTSTDDSLVREL